jgi:GH24 family phage-related lysozyme (muramidase)
MHTNASSGTGVLSDEFTDLRATRRAAELLRDFEDFSPTPYYDTNNWRIGFGSDTITLADGSIIRLPSDPSVRPDYTITLDDAERDLARRLPVFERRGIVHYVGKSAWRGLTIDAKAALISLAYNYGSFANLESVVRAIKTGNQQVIADAVAARAVDNNGDNENRRLAEAALIRDSGTSDEREEPPILAPIPETQSDDLWVQRLYEPPAYDEPQATLGVGRDELMAVYLKIAEQKYYKASGDVGLAKAWALAELKSRYGASRLSGQPVVMEQPPEANYPAINGGWDYLRTLALAQARSTDPTAAEVLLLSTATTATDRKAGQPPRYALWHRAPDGDWNLAPAPFAVELERLTQLQELAIDERRSRAAVVVARVRDLVENGRSVAV